MAFCELGDPRGTPLLFFHGAGSTRLTRHPDDSIVEQLGVRLITVDRPGVGLSDRCPRRRLLDWPTDVSQLADALSIDHFAVLGWSAGGPFALACAYRLPERVTATGVISGLAPLHWPGLLATVSDTWGRVAGLAETVASRSGLRLGSISPFRAGPTRPIEVRAVNRRRLLDLIQAREWSRILELQMLARPWGFHLQDIEGAVHLWHGSRDRTAPLYMAEHILHAIPRAVLTVFPGEGHHVGFTHWREVVRTLTRSAGQSSETETSIPPPGTA